MKTFGLLSFGVASILCLTGCAGTLKYSHSLDNLPGDPVYFAPDTTISPNSKLVARRVTVRMAPGHKTIKGADDPAIYEEFRAAYEREYLQKYLGNHCSFTKEGNGTDGTYYVDAEIEAVLFNSSKETKQLLGSLLFANLAPALQDKKMVKTALSVFDSSNRLVAAHRGDFEAVMGNNVFMSKEENAALATIADVGRLCGTMQASHAELAQRNGPAGRRGAQ